MLGRGTIYTVGTVAPILANVAVLRAVTGLLGKPGYGVVAIAIVVFQVAMMAASFGMPSVITRQGIFAASQQHHCLRSRAEVVHRTVHTISIDPRDDGLQD